MTDLVLGALAALGLTWMLVAAFALRRALRSVRRRAATTRARLSEMQMRVQPPGPRRDADLLRNRLQAEMRATHEMLTDLPDGLIFRANATTVLYELGATAAELDAELAAIGRFLDVTQQRDALAALRPQAEQLIETTYTARQTALRTAAEDRARRISSLQADVDRQAAALAAYQQTGRELQL